MVDKQEINVVKRGVSGKEPLNIDKIHDIYHVSCLY